MYSSDCYFHIIIRHSDIFSIMLIFLIFCFVNKGINNLEAASQVANFITPLNLDKGRPRAQLVSFF